MLTFQFVAIYINLAEHPARMECGTQLAATVFGPSYRRAAVMQIILALAATIAGISAWFLGAPRLWVRSILALGGSVVFLSSMIWR